MLSAQLGLLAGNQDQLAIVHFAPTADVSFTQLYEEHRPIKVAVPSHGRDFFLAGIDLHDGTGANEGMQGVLLCPNWAAACKFVAAIDSMPRLAPAS